MSRKIVIAIVLAAPLLLAGRCQMDFQDEGNVGGPSPATSPNDMSAGDAVGVMVNTAVPFLPPPWNAVVGGAVAIAAAVAEARRRQAKGAAKQIADSIEAVKGPDGTVNFNDPAIRKEINRIQGKQAKRIVDEVQGKS